MAPLAQLSFVNVIARDLDGLADFYQRAFELAEVLSERSAVYRAFDTGTTLLGFNAWAAYALLGLDDHATDRGVRAYLTFDPGSDVAVDVAVERLVRLGATLVKGPVRTPYDAWMSVLLDPEGNVARVSHLHRTPSLEARP